MKSTLLKGHRIDPNLYEEYDVKRGLRDSTGRGVLTGLTEVSDVCGFDVVNGRKILSCSFSDVFQKKMN